MAHSDWLVDAASQAHRRLRPYLRQGMSDKQWAVFEERLDAHFERLFRILHQLYGWRYDFAWIVESIALVAADGYRDRSKSLRRRDRKRGSGPQAWIDDASSLWAMAYVDRFAGTVLGLLDRVDHLENLGVTHLHLMPPYRTPPGGNDGGYAVSDYRSIRPELGDIADLRAVIEALDSHGISVVLDLICNHTAYDHPWATAAAAGDIDFADFYFMFEDRTGPDRYAPYLRDIFPNRGGDSFTWHPEVLGGRWIWTTFYPFQWDLNYQNPAVLAAMCGEMLFLANLGVGAIRMDATPFLWKREGTSCENLPETHLLLRAMRAVADIAAPSVEFLSEAIVHPDEVASYVNGEECRLGYNPLLMSSVWEALATRDTRLLRRALDQRFMLPPGCAWLTYLRSHDDIGWGFADEDAIGMGIDPAAHRRYLNAFYSGEFAGSVARGAIFQAHATTGDARISGTLASLAGLEAAVESMDPAAIDLAVRRILASFAIILGAGGIPLLFMGDTIASLNDHNYLADPLLSLDNRWMHRPPFDTSRLERARNGLGPEGAVYQGITNLLRVRSQLGIGPTILPRIIDPGDPAVVAYQRQSLIVTVNVSDSPVVVASLGRGPFLDLLTGEQWDGHVLSPYEYRWLEDQGQKSVS